MLGASPPRAPPNEILRGLISEERIDLLLSWRHSGFNIHNHTTVYPNDTEGLHPWRAEASAKAGDSLATCTERP